ncbi:hypothetical protein DFR86_03135 [Acidianus sulfidivorans JP7]|uniref:Uncharacterized protein n=1 Tax=Acidianus sulfidivorans JP7 TaxID=619593 RepID=A0A2U9IL44_9CREN|nr:hypothetical protein [Acidianus sulfidivorans]AWR96644.1 hypothetical protein DFR86_03135 [Acidianus sulfidivorans JP7]
MIGGVKDRTTEALLRFGDRARTILKAAISISEENERKELGDFDYKTLIAKLQELGEDKDPKMILRALERDYGIIESSYKSSNQHWWKFIDIDEVKSALDGTEEDPEIMMIKIQANSLNSDEIIKRLKFLLEKSIITDVDKAFFKKFAFDDLNYILEVYKKASQYEETIDIAEKMKKILILASKVSTKINGNKINKGLHEEEKQRKNSYVNSLRLYDGEDTV